MVIQFSNDRGLGAASNRWVLIMDNEAIDTHGHSFFDLMTAHLGV